MLRKLRPTNGLQGTGQPFTNVLTLEGLTARALFYVDLEVRPGEAFPDFVRGDVNDDLQVGLADAV